MWRGEEDAAQTEADGALGTLDSVWLAASAQGLSQKKPWQCQVLAPRHQTWPRFQDRRQGLAAKDVSGKAPEPDSVRQLEYQVNLACALLRSGQRSQAQEVSQRALEELEKLKGQGFMGWASLEYALRVNLSCALDAIAARKRQLQEAIALEPQRVEAKFHLAALLEEEKEPADALKVLMQALQIAPEDVNCLALACRCLEGLGRHTEALATATQLCAVDPASTFLALREVFHCQPEDVFVVTFPRCGTTWMVQIVVSCLFGFLPAGLFRLQRLCAGVRRRLLSADVWLLAFRSGMKFASCDMGKTGMRSLVARLPEDLERLELRFRWCSVGIDGASILAEKLPSSLRHLQLAFRGCGIGEPGARALAAKLPPQLQSLYLSMRGCPVGAGGAKAFAQHLPQELRE
eukprot:symbB.v1.2.040180.t1/scaffold7055.1/size13565/1